jgi:NitT/TauT family transport system substrate-binding protein
MPAPEVPAPEVPAPERPPLVVGYSALRISLPIFVAEQRGLFAARGVRVELRRYDTAQPLVEELVDGRIDAGGYAAIPIVLTVATRADRRVRVATGLVEDEAHPVSALLRRAGRAELAAISDLRGRRVGVLPTLAYTRWLEIVLRDAGVDPADVSVVPLAPPLQVQTLAAGGVDALFTGDPMATAALASGAGERLGAAAPVPLALHGPHVFGTFLVGDAVATERADEIAALLAALDEAIGVVNADPAGAREAMTSYVREPERPHVALYPDALYLPSRALDGARFADEVRRAASLGLVDAAPDVSGWTLSGAAP